MFSSLPFWIFVLHVYAEVTSVIHCERHYTFHFSLKLLYNNFASYKLCFILHIVLLYFEYICKEIDQFTLKFSLLLKPSRSLSSFPTVSSGHWSPCCGAEVFFANLYQGRVLRISYLSNRYWYHIVIHVHLIFVSVHKVLFNNTFYGINVIPGPLSSFYLFFYCGAWWQVDARPKMNVLSKHNVTLLTIGYSFFISFSS